MKIVVKQIDELRGTNFKNNVVEEFIVYLKDDTGNSLSSDIKYGKAAKNDMVKDLISKNFEDFEQDNIEVEEVSLEDYIKSK